MKYLVNYEWIVKRRDYGNSAFAMLNVLQRPAYDLNAH